MKLTPHTTNITAAGEHWRRGDPKAVDRAAREVFAKPSIRRHNLKYNSTDYHSRINPRSQRNKNTGEWDYYPYVWGTWSEADPPHSVRWNDTPWEETEAWQANIEQELRQAFAQQGFQMGPMKWTEIPNQFIFHVKSSTE
jgi:hypothetical protein